MGVNRYPLELREQVVQEYESGLGGCRMLARKHGLTRDTVRHWVRSARSKKDGREEEKIEMKKKTVKEIKEMSREELEKRLELSMLAADFWEFYANKLKDQIQEENKKKARQ